MSSTTTTETKSLSPAPTTPHVQIPRGPTKTKLVFYAPPTDGSAPYDHNGRVPHGQLQQNYILEAHDATINDIRGREEQFDLNINGFAVVPNVQSKMTDFHQSGAIEDIYYPEVQQLLFDKLPGEYTIPTWVFHSRQTRTNSSESRASGAKRIEIFDHTVRTSALNSKHQPVQRVHVDQTRESAEGRVRTAMGDEAEQLLGGRFRLINVWRPLNGPVLSSPLAVADSQSIPDEGLVMVEHRYVSSNAKSMLLVSFLLTLRSASYSLIGLA